MSTIRHFATMVLSTAILIVMTTVASLAGSQYEGTWSVADTGGKVFEITLAGDGSAKADRVGEGMTGTWKEEGAAAVITWDTGWTTKITKDGDKYTKTAFKKGEPMDGKPANSSLAKKVK